MDELSGVIEEVATESEFSGAVRVDGPDHVPVTAAYGLAHRGHQVPNTIDTRFGIASGGKALTALAVVTLIEDGKLTLAPLHARCSVATFRRSTTR